MLAPIETEGPFMTEFDRQALGLSRRTLLASAAAIPAAAALARARLPLARTVTRVRPGTAGWPTESEWAALSREVGGRLMPGARPAKPPSPELLANPFYVGDQVGLTQSSGWL